jgi:hypothetical protein
MQDLQAQQYIDTQDKAYLLQAKKHAEAAVAKALTTVEKRIKEFEDKAAERHTETLSEAKCHADCAAKEFTRPCLAATAETTQDEDYPVGSIVSVTVVCSAEEGADLFLANGPSVNTLMPNIYVRTETGNDKTKQGFHWANGKTVNSPSYSKLPGEWRNRGICGSFTGNIVSCKYFLAQRVS